jgi:hypothetical protein
MYILIDLDRLAVLHKHVEPDVLANLAWVEAHHSAYSIFTIGDARGLRWFTDMELKILYRNVTGVDHTLTRPQFMQVLNDAFQRVDITEANPTEVEFQAEFVKEGDARKWKYVKGAQRPALQAELYEPEVKCTNHSPEDEVNAKAGKLPSLIVESSSLKPGTGDKPLPANTKQAPKKQSAPKRGTAKAIIWATADALWEKEGKPTAKPDVLELRKRIMGLLEEEEGIKRASSSSELGIWHRTRVPQ